MCKTPTKSLRQKFVYNNLQTLDELRQDGTFCDLILWTKDKLEIKVHKNVMCSASGYFRDLFLSGMKESSASELDMENINGDILEIIVSFIYSGELKTTKIEELEEIVISATYLQIKELSEVCVLSLTKVIDDHNCLKYWRLAENCFEEKFEEMCISHILSNASRLFEEPEFLKELTVEEMKRLLSDDRLLCSEEFIFESALKWAKNSDLDNDNYLTAFSKVIDFIRFPLMSNQFLASNVLQDKELLDDKTLLRKIADCARYKWDENSENDLIYSKCTSPRIGSLKRKFLALMGHNVKSITGDGVVEVLQCGPTNLGEAYACTAFNNYHVLVCGGIQWAGITNSCSYFSIHTKEWKHFPALKVDRCNHECIFMDDKFYACGGFGSFKSVEIFDFGTEKWYPGSRMNCGFWNFGLTILNRALYALGGMDSFTINMFDPRAPEGWTTIQRVLRQPSSYTKCVTVDNLIYCLRDAEEPRIFDPRMNSCRIWECTSGVKPPGFFKACELGSEIGILYGNGAFLKYNVQGEITTRAAAKQTNKRDTDSIGALVALYY